MGAGRVLLGTDFPFPLGEQPAGQVVRSCPGLAPDDRRRILGENAFTFLKGNA